MFLSPAGDEGPSTEDSLLSPTLCRSSLGASLWKAKSVKKSGSSSSHSSSHAAEPPVPSWAQLPPRGHCCWEMLFL